MNIDMIQGFWILLLITVWLFLAYRSSQLKHYSSIMFYSVLLAPIISFMYPLVKRFIDSNLLVSNNYYVPSVLTFSGIFLLGWVYTLKDASEEDDFKWFILLFLIPPLALIYWFLKE